jgi:hypothetical protein
MSQRILTPFIVTLFLATLCLFSIESQAQALGAGEVQVTGVRLRGLGCPEGTVQVVLSPDGSAMTLLYDQFTLAVDATTARKQMECDVIIDIHKPAGHGFVVDGASVRGFIALDTGMLADQTIKVISGNGQVERQASAEFGTQSWAGPLSQDFELTAVRPVAAPELLSCAPNKQTEKFVIRSHLRIFPKHTAGSGQLTVDSVDGHLTQHYHLNWVKCALP